MNLEVSENIKSKVLQFDKNLNKITGYESNELDRCLRCLLVTGCVEVGYRSQCGSTHNTQKVYRDWVKVVKLLKNEGHTIKEEPVTHKNAYATNNGGFWNSTIYTIVQKQ